MCNLHTQAEPADPCRYISVHESDCAVHNDPAMPNGPCNCWLSKARSLYEHGYDTEDHERFFSRYGGELLRIADEAAKTLPMEAEPADPGRVAELAAVARAAQLPGGYQWGLGFTKAFEFGKERAALAIEATPPTPRLATGEEALRSAVGEAS